MESNTRIKARRRRKTNSKIVATINYARRQKAWNNIAFRLSGPTRRYASVNLNQINSLAKEGDTIVVPGKVLGVGTLDKRVKISALSYSESAKKKLKNSKIHMNFIEEEIKSNPKAEGVVVL